MQSVLTAALFWGVVSAVSLPLGAWFGIRWRPHSKVLSTLLAFGAGALLFALTVELLGDLPEFVEELGPSALAAGVGGALAGGLLFDLLNQYLNNRGAFLRNLSNAKEYVARSKRRRAKTLLQRLVRLEAFTNVAPEELADLASRVHRRKLVDGQTIFKPGDAANEIYFVRHGTVEISDPGTPEADRRVEGFDSFGALGVLTHMPRTSAARAVGPTVLYVLEEEDLEAASASSAAVRAALRQLAAEQAWSWRYREPAPEAETLFDEAEGDLGEMNMPVDEADVRHEREAMKRVRGVGMAIWLGIAIDAVPESLVIGTLVLGDGGMSIAFIVGVFLANFPEAMSSAVSMRAAGMGKRRVMLMWGSLCVLTGLGAVIGAAAFASTGDTVTLPLLFIEGLAAGAMLTAIAETMLPEAFEQGGSIVGFATLSGFLAALVAASL